MNVRLFTSLYIILLFFLASYQDFIGEKFLGFIGQSPIIFLVPIFIFTEFLNYRKGKISFTKFEKIFLVYTLISLIIGLINVATLFFQGIYSVHGENILIKVFKVLTYYGIIILFIRHLRFLFMRISLKELCTTITVLLFIFLFLLVFEYINLPYSFMNLHYTNPISNRIRFLTSESSYSGTIAIILFVMGIYLSKFSDSKMFAMFLKLLASIFIFLYATLTASKGFMSTILIVILLFIIISLYKRNRKSLFLIPFLIIGLFVAYIGLKDELMKAFMMDIEGSTSLTTRLGTIIVSLVIFIKYPLGVGIGAYLYYFVDNLSIAQQYTSIVLNKVFNIYSLNFSEFNNFYYSGNGMSAKSWFFNNLLFNGFFAIFLYGYMIKRFISKDIPIILKFGSLFIILGSIFYLSLDIKYEVWFFIAFLEFLLTKQKRGIYNEKNLYLA